MPTPSRAAGAPTRAPAPWLVLLLQLAFVLLFSSGFIVGRIATDAAHPFAILFWRFVVAGSLLSVLAVAMRAPWPRTRREWRDLAATGLLLQTMQYAGTYLAFEYGISASLSAMIMGMMPLLVALGSWRLLGEPLTRMQTVGTVLGFVGLLLATVLGFGGGDGWASIVWTVVGTLGIAAGTLYQRRFGMRMDLRSGGAIQLFVGAAGMLPIALLNGGIGLPMSAPVVFSVSWLATMNTLGAITLLLYFLQNQSAGEASSLFYLMPGVTAVAAWLILDQPIHWYTLVGLAITGAGLVLVTRYTHERRARRDLDLALGESMT
ncbi:DMT family transporter [Cumulibacter manganitolerans]|uniref:DMT family transporter n=1 Tax=Cumulibacter manganitolerans TaxID=1884992 RepID=UPI0012948AAB|nr:DMT family transporter [Cumulibacter manganitolerans]